LQQHQLTTKVAVGTTSVLGVAQYQQQGAIGKFNQSVANRNALVLSGTKRSNRTKSRI